MRSLICVHIVALIGMASLKADEPAKPISTAAAAMKVGEKVVVEMTVKSTGSAMQGLVFLNSMANFRDGKNFTVVLKREGLTSLRKAKVEDPKTYYRNKTVLVSGTVSLHMNKPQIEVTDAEQIKVK